MHDVAANLPSACVGAMSTGREVVEEVGQFLQCSGVNHSSQSPPRDALTVWERLRLLHFGDSNSQMCVMSPSSGLSARTVSALELQGGDLGSVQEGLAGAGHSRSPWPAWLCRVAADFGCSDRAGLAQGERRSLHIAHLPALDHPPNHPVQKGSCGTNSSGKKSPPSQQAASWDVVGYFG